MSDLIKRRDAIKELSKAFADCEPCDKEEASDIAVTTIKELPSVDRTSATEIMNAYHEGVRKGIAEAYGADRPPGHWEIYIVSPFDGEDCRCSECGAMGCVPYWDYCPYCGARMKGVSDDQRKSKHFTYADI